MDWHVFGMYLVCIRYVFVCISLYLHVLPPCYSYGFRPRLYLGLACIGMYLACICMYWFVYYKLDTDKYKPLQIFGLNTAQYKRNPVSIHREWISMYQSVMVCTVLIGMYCSVLVCILILSA